MTIGLRTSRLEGQIVSGLGKGKEFTQLDWAREQFVRKLGIDPYHGTLNLQLKSESALANWHDLKALPGYSIISPTKDNCNSRCYPVHIDDRFAAAIVYPEVNQYPAEQVEIIAPIPLREHLSLNDGDSLNFTVTHPFPVDTVLFDVDGTLVDTIEAFYMLAKRAAEEYKFKVTRDHIVDSLNYGTSFWGSVLPDKTAERETITKSLTSNAMQLWPQVINESGRVFNAVPQTLAKLKNKGFRLGIVTGFGGESLEMLYATGVDGLFDAVITGKDVNERKPHPEGLLKCLDVLGASAQRSVYIGDTPIDMQASLAAGMTAIGVLSGAGNSSQLCKAGAHRIIHNHQELPDILQPINP